MGQDGIQLFQTWELAIDSAQAAFRAVGPSLPARDPRPTPQQFLLDAFIPPLDAANWRTCPRACPT